VRRMVMRGTVCLRQLANSEADERRFGRWLGHDRVTVEEIRADFQARAAEHGGHVLAVQDTTELNFQHHAGKVGGLGAVGNGKDLGLFLHPVLALDADSGACLGVVDAQVWTRREGKRPDKRTVQDRESWRWLDGARAAETALRRAECVTVVADRESDLYPLLTRPRRPGGHFLVRAAQDRALAEGGLLMTALDDLPVAGHYTFEVTAQPARQQIAGKIKPGRSARPATLAVRYGEMTLKRPRKRPVTGNEASVTVRVVDVREIAPPDGEAPIHWRLLTSHDVSSVEQALRIVGWYQARWQVEQLFRTLKRQGLDLESSQVETAGGLMKLSLAALHSAAIVLQLVQARDGTDPRPATDAFTTDEIAALDALQPELEGRTEKQRNPHPRHSLAWAGWTIARLGGWKGYASKKPPGPITMHHGLQWFRSLYHGFQIARKMQTVGLLN
jgi:hypothetical protein